MTETSGEQPTTISVAAPRAAPVRRHAPPPGAPGRLLGGAGNVLPTAPPPSVPFTFLAAGGVGLVGFGIALALGANHAVEDPRLPGVVAAVHVGLLTFASTAVLGALHQFGPVVGVRGLRSIAAARITALLWIVGAWTLPNGFAHGPEWTVAAGGSLLFTAVLLTAWNVSAPLLERGRGVAVEGLRYSTTLLVATASFGIVYAFDRDAGWFPLLNHRVLAHAHLGLLGWLGLTYVAVAEKLWPMFLLSHRPSARSGAWAVRLLAVGAATLTTGILFASVAVGIVGGAVSVAGIGAHLFSLSGVVRHRRRRLELLHAFVLTSAVALVAAVVLGAAAALADVSTTVRVRLVSAEVAALFAWISLAIVGHAHKIVPFISWGLIRDLGISHKADGHPVLFADLYDDRLAQATFASGAAGAVLVIGGLLSGTAPIVAAGAILYSLCGAIALVNLGLGPGRAVRTIVADLEAAAADAPAGSGAGSGAAGVEVHFTFTDRSNDPVRG